MNKDHIENNDYSVEVFILGIAIVRPAMGGEGVHLVELGGNGLVVERWVWSAVCQLLTGERVERQGAKALGTQIECGSGATPTLSWI